MTREQLAKQVAALANATSELSLHELSDAEVVGLATDLTHAQRMIEATLIAVADRLEAVDVTRATGWATTKDLLTHLSGGHKGAGGSLVRLATALRQRPEVATALAAGGLSVPQARVIATRVNALPRDEEFRTRVAAALVELVRVEGLDATDLDHATPGIVRELDPDGRIIGSDRDKPLQEHGAHLARFLSFSPDRLGGVQIKGYASPEEAELVKATPAPARRPCPHRARCVWGRPRVVHLA